MNPCATKLINMSDSHGCGVLFLCAYLFLDSDSKVAFTGFVFFFFMQLLIVQTFSNLFLCQTSLMRCRPHNDQNLSGPCCTG